jgi:hypothetical protein
MSIACGACRKMVSGEFVVIFRLEKDSEGNLLFPDEEKKYLPPNSIICANCLRQLPAIERKSGVKNAAKKGKEVFAFAEGSWPSGKSLDGIATGKDFVFVKPDVVRRHFPRAVEIIEHMAARKK